LIDSGARQELFDSLTKQVRGESPEIDVGRAEIRTYFQLVAFSPWLARVCYLKTGQSVVESNSRFLLILQNVAHGMIGGHDYAYFF
jgi:hypothetical protein